MVYTWQPTLAQVQPHIFRRIEHGITDDETGAIVAFTEESSEEVVAEVGVPPETLHGMATAAATYLTAYKFERAFYPEQTLDGTAQLLRDDYVAALARLRTAMTTTSRQTIGSVSIKYGFGDADAVIDPLDWS